MRVRHAAILALITCLAFLARGIPGEPEKKVIYSRAKSKFLKTFKRGNDEKKVEAVAEFALQDDPRAVKLILQHALFSGSSVVVDAAFQALTLLTNPRAWAVIVEQLRKEKSTDRRFVHVRLLGFYGDASNEAIIGLEKALEDGPRDMRIAALRSLGQIKAKRSVKLLEELLEEDDLRIVFEAAKTLEAITGIERKTYADPKHTGIFPDDVFTGYLYILIDASEEMDYDMPVPAADRDLLPGAPETAPKEKEKVKKTEKKRKPKKKKEKSKKRREEPAGPKEPETPKDILTRFDYASKKLVQFLQKLDKRVEVKVAFFSSTVQPFNRDFAPVGDFDIESFKKRARVVRPHGNRDLFKALQTVFSEKNLDSVILVASGLPTMGVDDPERIVRDIIEYNRFRTVEITASAILSLQIAGELPEEERVGLNEYFNATESLLQELAKATGGGYSKLRLLREADKEKKPEKEEKEPEKTPEKKPRKPPTLSEAKNALKDAVARNNLEDARTAAGDLAGMNGKKAAEAIAESLFDLDSFDMVQTGVEALRRLTDGEAITWLSLMIRREKDETRRLHFIRSLYGINHITAERTLCERLKKDPSWRIRSQAARIIGYVKLEKGRELLRETMKDRSNRIAYDAAIALAGYDGEKLPEEFSTGERGVFPEKIFSRRIAVVISASDSMRTEVEDPDWDPKKAKPEEKKSKGGARKKKGEDSESGDEKKPPRVSRLEVVKRRLASFIDRLPENTGLVILTFGDTVNQWKSEFQPMTKSGRAAARQFVERIRPIGRNRAADTALLRALDLPDVDTICFVSDGMPEGRDVLASEELVRVVTEINYFRMAYIHTAAVLVAEDYKDMSAVDKVIFNREKDRTVKMLDDLAGYNGGSFFKAVPEE